MQQTNVNIENPKLSRNLMLSNICSFRKFCIAKNTFDLVSDSGIRFCIEYVDARIVIYCGISTQLRQKK